jgi:hypothetical protein
MAEFIWYAQLVADLEVGKSRPLVAVEVQAERELALEPGNLTATRSTPAAARCTPSRARTADST